MNAFEELPLAKRLSEIVDPIIENLVDGNSTPFLDQVTPTTAELVKFWFQRDFCELRENNFHDGQRSAILHVIYAHEVLEAKSLADMYEKLLPQVMQTEDGVVGEVTRERHNHPKYAVKMATGTGKTWVLNALIVWQYLNRAANPEDTRFSKNFLVVAPGLIVYDRLLDSFFGKMHGGKRDFHSSDIYSRRKLFVPDPHQQQVFSFLQSSAVTKTEIGNKVTGSGMLAITNWHLLAGQEDPNFIESSELDPILGEEVDAETAVKSFIPLTPGVASGNELGTLDKKYLSGGPLKFLKELPDLVVFNDEAHHIHEIKKSDEVTDVEWQKSLLEIAKNKGSRFVQVDFSATPYNQINSRAFKGKAFFPHIVVDFDLNSAMRVGLVKSLALDKRKSIAALPLEFRAERDEKNRVIGLSEGQRVMLQAGLTKLKILETQFQSVDPHKHPKLMIICEDTSVTPFVVEYLLSQGLSEDEVLRVDSGRKSELSEKDWEPIRERLFDIDHHQNPRVIVSVLMLREGFDVNNICVIVPLRSSQASILLEQTVGRGLRNMWRGNPAIEEMKSENRQRISRGEEPQNYFDVLFIVEHPAFSDFYKGLIDGGLMVETDDDPSLKRVLGDLELVSLQPEFEAYDFAIPFVVHDAEEHLSEPKLDPLKLRVFPVAPEALLKHIGTGNHFISQDAQTGTSYGDYRVDSGVISATGYNDYLARMTIRVTEAIGQSFTKSQRKYNSIAKFPLTQMYRPLVTKHLDSYIRRRLFGGDFDPQSGENWRVLLVTDVAQHIASEFSSELIKGMNKVEEGNPHVRYRRLSEVETLPVRHNSSVEVSKCIYPKLPIPTHGGGLEKRFIEWMNRDSSVEAFAKIHEYQHDFLRRPYLKADGMPAQYSPDFLVRTGDSVYVVETKAHSALSDENVQRKRRSAVSWCDQINILPAELRENREWAYVLLDEFTVIDWESKNQSVIDLLQYARLISIADEAGKLF